MDRDQQIYELQQANALHGSDIEQLAKAVMDDEKNAARRPARSGGGSTGPLDAVDEFAELMSEIEDRKRFLDQMRRYGKADVYEGTIKREIAERVQKLQALDQNLVSDGR
eukprot:SAG31_NODE_6516_length_1990_cov_1.471179_2_plen_110_part_00